MNKTPWTMYLWPGLPQLWLDGAVSGLLLAVGCGALLNLVWLASFVWNELLTAGQLRAGWALVATVWILAGMFASRVHRRRRAVIGSSAVEDLFQAAVSEYLRGHWYETEAHLSRLLAVNADDVEARLLWATLLRRTRRYAESKAQLSILERLDGAFKWREETAREWQLLGAAQSGLAAWLNVPEPAAPAAQARAA